MKNLKLLSTVLFLSTIGMFLLLNSCNKENLNNDLQNNDNQFIFQKITHESINKNLKLVDKLNKILKTNHLTSSNNLSKTIFNYQDEFYIDTSIANFIEYGNYHSYTFPIYRFIDDGFTENLFLSLQADGTYLGFLVSYDITPEEKERLSHGLDIDLEGKISYTLLKDDKLISDLTLLKASAPYISGDGAECADVETRVYSYCDDINGNQIRDYGDLHDGCVDNWIRKTVTTITIDTDCLSSGGGGGTSSGGENSTTTDPNDLLTSGGGGTIDSNNTSTGTTPSNGSTSTNDSQDTADCLESYEDGSCVGDITSPIIMDKMEYKWNSFLSTLNTQLIDYLNNNSLLADKIKLFLSQNVFSNEAKEFANLAVQAFADQSEFDLDDFEDFQQQIPDYIANMTQDEIAIFNNMSEIQQDIYLYNGYKAINKARELFPNTYHYHNDIADAFRHAYFHALNTYYLSYSLSLQLGDAHENETPDSLILEKTMDLFNNSIGRDLAQNPPIQMNGYGTLIVRVWNAVQNGDLMHLYPIDPPYGDINSNTQLIPTNQP